MKHTIYRGWRNERGRCVVQVQEVPGLWVPLAPTGCLNPDVDWGYGGGGPKELALSLLAHHLNNLPLDHEHWQQSAAGMMYDDFLLSFIGFFSPAASQSTPWTLTGMAIDLWIRGWQANPPSREDSERQAQVLSDYIVQRDFASKPGR